MSIVVVGSALVGCVVTCLGWYRLVLELKPITFNWPEDSDSRVTETDKSEVIFISNLNRHCCCRAIVIRSCLKAVVHDVRRWTLQRIILMIFDNLGSQILREETCVNTLPGPAAYTICDNQHRVTSIG